VNGCDPQPFTPVLFPCYNILASVYF
jgi:hypothetical protein